MEKLEAIQRLKDAIEFYEALLERLDARSVPPMTLNVIRQYNRHFAAVIEFIENNTTNEHVS